MKDLCTAFKDEIDEHPERYFLTTYMYDLLIDEYVQ